MFDLYAQINSKGIDYLKPHPMHFEAFHDTMNAVWTVFLV